MTTRQWTKAKRNVDDPFSDRFREFYHSKDATDPKMRGRTTPTGVHNFDAFSEFGTMARIRRAVETARPGKFLALIDGFSTPMNVVALKDFLVRTMGIPQSAMEIHAVDLSDEAFEEGLKLARERDIRFTPRVGDARSLPFDNGMFALVFQDFLLNCAPNGMHGAIIDETERILRPDIGFGLIGVTSVEGQLNRVALLLHHELGLEPGDLENAFKIGDLPPRRAERFRGALASNGQFLLNQGGDAFVLVTNNEDFEFFRTKTDVAKMLENGGLTIMEARLDIGTDRFGNVCHRNRFILSKNPERLAVENPEAIPSIRGGEND